MKFTVIKDNFSKNLQLVGKAVNTRSPLPILSNVLIKTEKGRIKLSSSNLQIAISAWMGAKVDEQGEITIPAKLLTEFTSQLREDKVDFTLVESVLKLSTEKTKATFNGMPGSEFPDFGEVKSDTTLTIEYQPFVEALNKVQFAVAVDEGRPVLTGIYFKVQDNNLLMATTDGFRMAECKLPIKEKVKEPIKCIIPAKYLIDFIKSLPADLKTVTINIDNDRNLLGIKVEDVEAQIRMIEGEYPDYHAVIPEEHTTEIRISKEELASGIKLANVFAKDLGNMVKISIEGGAIKAISQPTESGSNSTDMQGEVEGEDLQIAFNAKYLLDLVNNVDADEILFRATESVKPGLFKIAGEENYLYVVMPMKANW